MGDEQNRLRGEYLSFVGDRLEAALDRDGGPEHITASCFVFTPDLSRVLLCFHKKGRFWVQLGGHIESTDDSIAVAALREAREECGIRNLRPLGGGVLLDVDRHSLGDGFSRCSVHWDIGFGAISHAEATPSASSESEDVAWWPVKALPQNVPPDFGVRMERILHAIWNRASDEEQFILR